MSKALTMLPIEINIAKEEKHRNLFKIDFSSAILVTMTKLKQRKLQEIDSI